MNLNQLSRLPEGFENISKLRELHLGTNEFSVFPAAICKLKKLQILDMSENKITELPSGIGQLSELTSLDLSNNQLTELPPAIGNLSQLTSLNISGNPLKSIPAEIEKLTNLREFYYDSAHLSLFPDELFKMGILPQRYIYHIPTSIGGKPVEYYMNDPDIDTLSKLYIRRELDLRKGDLRGILESIEYGKPDTRSFYFFVFNNILVHYKFGRDTTEMERPDKISTKSDVEFSISRIAADYLVNDPCIFFEQLKNNEDSYFSEMLKSAALDELPYGFVKDIDEDVKQKIRNSCGGKYLKDWEEIINLVRAEWNREQEEYEEK